MSQTTSQKTYAQNLGQFESFGLANLLVGDLVDSDGTARMIKAGQVTGISTAAVAVATSVVDFTNAFPNGVDLIILSMQDLTGGVVTGVYTSAESKTGFTINANVTTAGAGTTVAVSWLAFGH